MLTYNQLRYYIELVENTDEIQDLVISTGHGLLRDTSTDEVYMGLLGHNKHQSEQALHDWNWHIDPDNIDNIFHKHGPLGTGDQPHNTNILHYEWEIKTIHPMDLKIRKLDQSHGHVVVAFFEQELSTPTKLLDNYKGSGDFTTSIISERIFVRLNHLESYQINNPQMSALYRKMWAECIKVYYLYCQSIPPDLAASSLD